MSKPFHYPPDRSCGLPFVKWAGGKGRLLKEIRALYPPELGASINKYAEPFVGGGAVLFDILNNYTLSKVYISDINKELINTYITIRDYINDLIKILKQYEHEYISANTNERKIIYYKNRNRFNNLKDFPVESAALFIFLNRTCFNGLYRVNANGDFNVPQGLYKNPCICNEINLYAVSKILNGVEIVCGDYKLAENFIDNKTFVYFDPPYRPLTKTANFISYTKDKFNDAEQKELADFINMINKKGAYIIASNSDPKNIDESDDFFDELYSQFNIIRIKANRSINSNGAKRGKIDELLIVNK